MPLPSRVLRYLVAAAVAPALLLTAATQGALGAAQSPATGAAPGAPGTPQPYLGSDKSGFGTAAGPASTVWLTAQRSGGLGEIYYPDLSTPSARSLQFVVVDGQGTAIRASAAASVTTSLRTPRSLRYQQTFADPGWRLTADYLTDPGRPTVLADISFATDSPQGYTVYAVYEPTLANTPGDDSGVTRGHTLIASDGTAASALAAVPDLTATSSGFRGTSDGWTDLQDGRLDWRYSSASAGNLIQTARLGFAGRPGQQHATLAIGFGATSADAGSAVRSSLRTGFRHLADRYDEGWNAYLLHLKRPPASLGSRAQRDLYLVSAMVLAASEDKTHRGAYVASPTMPWVWGAENPSGPYHLVWSRDLYQIATGLIAAGDRAGAGRALDYLFTVQQKADGSFPQNSRVDGTPVWTGLQLDEVALPIVLAYQLGRNDTATWSHVRSAADFLIGFTQDGQQAPWSPQDRWENQSGYSPAAIASQIAGLVCAASIARANGDSAASQRYLSAADTWQRQVKGWTVTTTGPYSSGPYFLRLTKDGDPDAATTYTIGDSGPSNVDQRKVVDPSFLDLVRLGVLPAKDPAVVNSLRVVDARLGVPTPRGMFWHRASFDGYGEKADGAPWEFGLPDDSFITRGRAWPLLGGERGEYQLAAGQPAEAAAQLTTMARAASPGYLLPEQVWDDQPPSGRPGFTPGTPTFSATPLAWTHAQFIRLAQDVSAGRILEQPDIVAARYARAS